MPKFIDGDSPGAPRRVVLKGVGALLPAVILGATGAGVAAAASLPPADDIDMAGGAVQGAFSATGYSWQTALSASQAAEAVSGVVFALTADGRPLAGRRVRFSISAFHTVDRSVWFETAPERRSVSRLGYLDLDTDASGTVLLDRWLRLGPVPTAAIEARPALRAQLVGSETILASARLSVV